MKSPMLIGIAGGTGSGKSTYTKTKIDARTKILASDEIRKELFGFEEDQDHNDDHPEHH